MDDSWSLISVVKECSRKTQSRAPEIEGGLNINATTARPSTVDKVTNYLPNQFSNQFGAGSSSGQPLQNLQNPYFCNQFNAGTNSTTKTTRLATGVGNTDYLPNPFSNQFGAGSSSSSGELLQNLENILFSDDEFNANATTTTSAQPTTVVEIDDDYLPNPFSDQFGASNNSSVQNSQNLQNPLFCDQFDASATDTSFQDLLFSVEFGAGTNTSNPSMQSPLISHQSDTSNAFHSLLPVASTAEGNVCGNHLRDYLSQPALLFQPVAAAAAPAPAPDAPVISTPAGPLLQEFKEVPDTPDHMFSQCQGSCTCPDGFHCGLGKKRSVYIMDIEELKGLDDKWAWRKYGQKPIRGSPYPRNYYKCSSKKNCMAKKQVERSYEDPEKYIVTYIGQHYHPFPPPRANNGGPRPKYSPDLPLETESPATGMVTQLGGPSGSGCRPELGSGSGSKSRSGSGEMGGDEDGGAAGNCGGNDEEQEENNLKIVIPEAVVDMDSLLGENMEGMVVEERREIDDVNYDFFDVILHESGYGYEYGYGYEKNMSVCDPNVYNNNGVQENGRTRNESENIGGGNPETTLAPATVMVGANEPPRNEACNIWGW